MTASDLIPDSAEKAATARSATEVHPLRWSVRRELWENRYLVIAPLVVNAFVLLGTIIAVALIPRHLPAANAAREHTIITGPFSMAPAPIMLATIMAGVFYCIDALYGERRDRSILFWKSLPVSDRTVVLSKLAVPMLVLPLLAFVLSVVTQLILLTFGTFVFAASGVGAGRLWSEFAFFEGLPIMIYGLAVHALWFAPIYGWLLLVSAWAKRAPLLWAVLPLLIISAFERLASGSWGFMAMLQNRIGGAMPRAFDITSPDAANIERLSQLTPLRFLMTPGLWLGLAFAAVCLAIAIRLRRNREPI
ncbi:MAG TPA: ABC transporter permease [Thermoanaerobaculia bacterium]